MKAEPTGFADGSDRGTRKSGGENASSIFSLSHRENGVASNCDGEEGDFGGAEHLNIFLMLKLRYLVGVGGGEK